MSKNKNAILMAEKYQEIRVICKYCGHRNTLPVFIDKQLCWFCNKNIENDTKAHFKYKLLKKMKRNDSYERKVIKED